MKKIKMQSSFEKNKALLSKPHFLLLDALRGVAALIVLVYHFFEAFATSSQDQMCNHGYLAVDFFFILSGFVIGYAYDDRWKTMRLATFFKRRLIRLHPMVIIGVLLGAITFIIQGGEQWDGTKVSTSMLMLAMLLNIFMLPALPGTGSEVRGNGEMFPLNGPNWSLFFEYIGNVCYALFIHRLSTRALSWFVTVLGALLFVFCVFNMSGSWHLGVGWSVNDWGIPAGLLRMLFSYTLGMLLARKFKPCRVRGAFWVCTLTLIVLLSLPFLGKLHNAIFEIYCIAVVFPCIVWIAASGSVSGNFSKSVCSFLGDISYPVYVVHYPFMYLFYNWVWDNNVPLTEAWHVGVMIIIGSILLAWMLFNIYDKPVRRWLLRRVR